MKERIRKTLVKASAYLAGAGCIAGITMLDGNLWLLGGCLTILTGAYLTLFAWVNGAFSWMKK